MHPIDIHNESDLRTWLTENVSPKVSIQWVEPGRYGSTIGAADAHLSCGTLAVSLELKIWETTRRGIKCVMRPIQRRWHHMSMRSGKRTAILAHIKNGQIILVRGDHIPLRDYADDARSGCKDGSLEHSTVFTDLNRLLFDESYEFWLS